MSKNKRMIYIYDENIAKYDALENKAEWVNKKLKELPIVEDEKQTNEFEEKIRSVRGRGQANRGTEQAHHRDQ